MIYGFAHTVNNSFFEKINYKCLLIVIGGIAPMVAISYDSI